MMDELDRLRVPSWEDEERLSLDHLRFGGFFKRQLLAERIERRADQMRRRPARTTHDGTSPMTRFVDFAFDPARAHTRTVLGLSLVRRSWETAVSDLLYGPSGSRFWQRVLIALHSEYVVHPELDAPRMLDVHRIWIFGADRSGFGAIARNFNFALEFASMFCFFTNIDFHEGARPIGWVRLAVSPWLEGTELAQERRETFVARLIDTIIDFDRWQKTGISVHFMRLYRALVDFLGLQVPDEPIYAANWTVTTRQTARFCDFLRQFAPLFPQEPRLEEDRHGEERHVLVPCKWNHQLRVDEGNTDDDQSFWEIIDKKGGS